MSVSKGSWDGNAAMSRSADHPVRREVIARTDHIAIPGRGLLRRSEARVRSLA